ncbi:hypothetical protein C5167_004984 [Papaver somniferum]|uniref:Uncharacterized protein n=1 Tax=Papaver somniferum TaxID=3469 RepID=A0A4Y7JCA4_PAPSO|nr:uncharacterized protein LOC113273692 isoform X2 [Papaver somniferum]RZC57682.1 hypothetical protein C5167_004984 [Papaver somniferum]
MLLLPTLIPFRYVRNYLESEKSNIKGSKVKTNLLVRSKSTSFKAEMERFFGELKKGKTLPQEVESLETKAARKARLKQTISDIGFLGIPLWFSILLAAHVLTKPSLITPAADPGKVVASR